MRLSERLITVASFVEQGAIVADIGSDHAYLPCYLVKKGIIQKAIAGEVAAGPFDSALRNVKREGLEGTIIIRLADGLLAIEGNDGVDTVTIAGMGGTLIATILESGKDRLATVNRIITQPNIHARAIREWAITNNWTIIKEKILKEDGKIYEVIVLERGKAFYNELELLLGPFLLKEKNVAFLEKWEGEISQWNQIIQSIEDAGKTISTVKKKEQLARQIRLVEEVLVR